MWWTLAAAANEEVSSNTKKKSDTEEKLTMRKSRSSKEPTQVDSDDTHKFALIRNHKAHYSFEALTEDRSVSSRTCFAFKNIREENCVDWARWWWWLSARIGGLGKQLRKSIKCKQVVRWRTWPFTHCRADAGSRVALEWWQRTKMKNYCYYRKLNESELHSA